MKKYTPAWSILAMHSCSRMRYSERINLFCNFKITISRFIISPLSSLVNFLLLVRAFGE